MTKEAVRKREYRAKFSDEKKNAIKAENAERSKLWRMSGTPEEIETRKIEDAARKQRATDKLTDEEKAVKTAKESAQRKARRHAAKALANQGSPNSQNQVVAEFQRIQTVPKGLASKNPNLSFRPQVSNGHVGGLPCRNDGSALNEDSMSEYERIRHQNIEERKKKFQELFGTNYPFEGGPCGPSTQSQKRSQPISNNSSESSSEEINPTSIEPTRKQPKRQCKSFFNELCESYSSDSSFDAYVDDLVEASAAELEVDPHMIVTPIVNNIINSIFGPKPRKQNIGRKSKRAVKSSKYRKFHETDDQYQSRLKKSSALKQDNLKNEERSVRKRRLYKLQQTRYV